MPPPAPVTTMTSPSNLSVLIGSDSTDRVALSATVTVAASLEVELLRGGPVEALPGPAVERLLLVADQFELAVLHSQKCRAAELRVGLRQVVRGGETVLAVVLGWDEAPGGVVVELLVRRRDDLLAGEVGAGGGDAVVRGAGRDPAVEGEFDRLVT